VRSLYIKKSIAKFLFAVLSTLPTILCATPADMEQPHLPSPSIYRAYPPTNDAPAELAASIKRGEYLAKMGDCLSCHSDIKHNGESFAGGLAMKTPFGTFYTPNITPDKQTGIGAWTKQDFIRALKEGINPQGQNYFPVFPYVFFANMSDEDAGDLFTYLMNIPAVHAPNKPLPFPFNVPGARLTLLGWKLLFYYPNTPLTADPSQSKEWNRGKYLVDSLGHCSMCHTPLNPLGSPKAANYLTGGFIEGYWAPNIGRDGLKSATVEEIDYVFTHNELINHAGPVAGPMAQVNVNSLAYLTDADRLSIATYLKTVVSTEPNSLPPSNNPPTLARGQRVYRQSCTICHQNGEMSAPLIGSAPSWFARLKENGLTTLYDHVINGYNSMPVKGACVTCSDNDIRAAVDYLLHESLSRSQWLDLQSAPRSNHDVKDNHAK
jgi:cytochrome c5